ncbi:MULTISPECIES: cell wall metabolism sensor histidine kinase WalK [Lactobacillus]|uniref:cell wall metabolism sensor histidine kinase WalK n=1 Tax=Lactobacillus TaxID=1578 RepID=UPI0001B2AFC5|nr:cell wall metabolism sensor histidine kinase WalK [Lactobacillus mulieris]EEX23597.1 sensor protein kinase WalK [Lactobacillus jensenii 115-3-CHN]KAA9243912.1 cell wall metabolism sensor histidine kinase WalK [Lactobacillus jensenii]TRT40119.1 cell wall metabolism sensor histidine kinase WalK [Lactobacillus sp. c10Ua232AE]KAA9368739.1 cell wall metabolism sensor histidine kinase WalK [Lactobacillus jensenii]KAA9372461.1 cell wall metabolism sensor histidine kinase WalK [Lactobacillus jensen
MKKIKSILNSLNTKIAVVFMLMILATIEIIGAYFTRQLEQSTIESFQTSIQIPTIITNSLATQLSKNTKKADEQLSQIVSNYNNSAISEIIVVDNKDVIRAVSNLNDKSRVGQRATNVGIKQVTSTGRQITWIDSNNNGSNMVQITPLTIGTGTNSTLGAIYVRANMQGVFDNLRNISYMFLTASFAASILSAILALFISRAITKPIEEMRMQALQVADGDYSGQVKIYSNDELGQLAEAFNTLSIRVERSQEQSESERRRLDSVLSHMTDGVIATDRHGNVIILNQMALSFLDIKEKDAVSKPITKILGLDDDVSAQELIGNQQEMMITVNEGTPDEMILHANFSLIRRVTGFVSGAVCVLHDVTEQQKNENEQRQFVSNVSHELRTPLTSLRAYIEALNDGAWKDPEIAPQFLEVTQEETERMIRMINDLLSLSRMDRGVVKMDLEWVNFNDFLSHVLNRFDMIVKNDEKDQTGQKKYSIKRKITNQDLWVEIDTDQMMQVIDNIMNNAIKYSPDGGVITVGLTQSQNQIILSISDQGLGIPKKDLNKIFDRFYRVDKARSREQGGTGLGLAIAKEIVEAHKGKIWADSQEGKGSTFYISLPFEPMSEEDDWDEV